MEPGSPLLSNQVSSGSQSVPVSNSSAGFVSCDEDIQEEEGMTFEQGWDQTRCISDEPVSEVQHGAEPPSTMEGKEDVAVTNNSTAQNTWGVEVDRTKVPETLNEANSNCDGTGVEAAPSSSSKPAQSSFESHVFCSEAEPLSSSTSAQSPEDAQLVASAEDIQVLVEKGKKQCSADEAAGGGRDPNDEPKPSPEEEELMKKVPTLFEAMNEASEDINKLENSFTEAQLRYRHLANHSNNVYEDLRFQYGSALDQARPYFDAWEALERSQLRVQNVIRDFSEAASRHAQAKSELRTIEERLQYGAHRVNLNRDQQDGLSQATVRVLQSQQERDGLEREYAKALKEYQVAQAQTEEQKAVVGETTIRRAMPGFRQWQEHRRAVVHQQHLISTLEDNILKAKGKYNGSLKELDSINQSIHKLRGKTIQSEP